MHKHPIHDRRHPAWCDRPRGASPATARGGTPQLSRHTPATLEQVFELTLVQHSPDCAPELILEVTDTDLAIPDGVHVLTLPEIKALAETLLIEYLKAAQLTSTPPPARPARQCANDHQHPPVPGH